MATTDEELQAKQLNVEDLRQQVADVNAGRLKAERELSNDITATELDAEAAKLEAQLAELKRQSTVAVEEKAPRATKASTASTATVTTDK